MQFGFPPQHTDLEKWFTSDWWCMKLGPTVSHCCGISLKHASHIQPWHACHLLFHKLSCFVLPTDSKSQSIYLSPSNAEKSPDLIVCPVAQAWIWRMDQKRQNHGIMANTKNPTPNADQGWVEGFLCKWYISSARKVAIESKATTCTGHGANTLYPKKSFFLKELAQAAVAKDDNWKSHRESLSLWTSGKHGYKDSASTMPFCNCHIRHEAPSPERRPHRGALLAGNTTGESLPSFPSQHDSLFKSIAALKHNTEVWSLTLVELIVKLTTTSSEQRPTTPVTDHLIWILLIQGHLGYAGGTIAGRVLRLHNAICTNPILIAAEPSYEACLFSAQKD